MCVCTPSRWTKSAGASSGSLLRGGLGAGASAGSLLCGGFGAGSSVGVLARFRLSRLLRRGVDSAGSGSSGSVAMGGSSRLRVLCGAGIGGVVGCGGGVVGGGSGGVVVVGCGADVVGPGSLGGAPRSRSLTRAASSRIFQGISAARGVLPNEGSARSISDVSYCVRGSQRAGRFGCGYSPGLSGPRPSRLASPAAGRGASLRARRGGSKR